MLYTSVRLEQQKEHTMRLLIIISVLFSVAFGVQAANYNYEKVATGLNYPWSIAFLPEGGYLVALRSGSLHRISENGELGPAIANTPQAYVKSQGGYFDVVLDPNYSINNTVYLSFAAGEPKSNTTAVIRAEFRDNALVNVKTIFKGDMKDTPVHYGGRIVFLNDGTLLVLTGDGFDYREKAQDPHSLLGKLVRINSDGSIPKDNPFADGKHGHPAVYAYGIRSPQGLTYDSENNTVYMHEHGPKGGDEVNLVAAGANYGWPAATHGVNYSGAKVSPFTSLPGMVDPIHVWVPSIAPSGFALIKGDTFPQWHGDLLIGALVNKEVRRLEMDGNTVVSESILFDDIGERIRDVRQAPSGNIYLLTDSEQGEIIRVVPAN